MKDQKIVCALVIVLSLTSYAMAHGYGNNMGRNFGNFQEDFGNDYMYNGGFSDGHALAIPEMHPFPYVGLGGNWIGHRGGVADIHTSAFPGVHPFLNGGMVGGSFGYPGGYGAGFQPGLFFRDPAELFFRPAIRPAMFTRFSVLPFDYGRPLL